MDDMLAIAKDSLPQTCLSYFAFRLAFGNTLERIALESQVGNEVGMDPFGYLTEVPFLRNVPAHVQLDLLAETWQKHIAKETVQATLVDEGVVYAACETAARIVENEPDSIPRYVDCGPLDVHIEIDHFLASELRNLHLSLSNEGDFLLISQFEDMHPDESRRLKKQFNLEEDELEAMFEVLGWWYVSADLMRNLDGLLTEREIVRAVTIISGEGDVSE